MQLRRQDNVAYASIADTTAGSPGAVVITPSTLAAGAAALIDEGNLAYVAPLAFSTVGDDRKFRIVQNIAGKLVFSAAFSKGAISKPTSTTFATVKQFSAAQQQITRIGYNGTTGALPTTTVKTGFFIKLRKNDNDAANRSQPASLFAQFATDATGSQEELAHGLVASGIKNMSTQPAGNNGYVKFEALCDEAGAAVTGTLVNLVFTDGSTEVVSNTNNVTITNIAAGDAIKIAAALTSPVYKVKSVTNGTATTPAKIVLTYAYQGTTVSVAKATCRRILEAAHLIAEYGVQVRGVASDFDVNAFRNYYSNRFTATFSDTTVKITHVQGALDGAGMWQQVAMEEYMSMGNQGENGMLGVPPTMRTSSVVTDGQYDAISISIKEDINGLVSAEKADAEILIFVQDGSGSPSGLAIAAALGVNTLLT
jgi:hypothetical protein